MRKTSIRKPIDATGWKPRPKWFVSLLRGSEQRMTRSCDSLEDGQEIAELAFKRGWDVAWVYEKN